MSVPARSFVCLAFVFFTSGFLTAGEEKTFRVTEGAFPWHDRVGVWRMVDVPDVLKDDTPIAQQACGARVVVLPEGLAAVTLGMNARDVREARKRKLPFRETDLTIGIQSPKGGRKLTYYVVVLDDPPVRFDLKGGSGMVVLRLNAEGIPVRDTPVALPVASTPSRKSASDLVPPKKPLAQREAFHLYLLIGQSNMAGRGRVEAQDLSINPRVLTLGKAGRWVVAVDPIHFDKSIAGVGLGTSFGKKMAEQSPGAVVGLIPCAVGGSKVGQWQKDSPPTGHWGHLYGNAVERTKLALRDGVLKGVLWHQGEGDSSSSGIAAYRDKLTRMLTALQADLGVANVPFVAGELGVWDPRKHAGRTAFNRNLAELPTWTTPAAVVSSEGLGHNGDNTHFGSAGLREFGGRYAEAMQRLQAAAQ
ncbi:MAG: sialate O-acetylesterase [Lentisphaerae bacterium]|jgi:hypothetical protein|nr:sialate O-acetylesterase [Lentisphaerota bacterium]MBT5611047.1 sialate O-acetylesterase [Lentisphaerota bacterium]MBT7053957.1 sialate O-acetylesterase [Lentisphaerota bacterium]MBT7841039.1 sialate O-acetylesterase [Lentisphaerota bacterium]